MVLQEYPDAKLDVFVVWIKMNEGDTSDVVDKASKYFKDDSRVTQFYDLAQISGLEVAKGFGAETGEVAWDIYLFYVGQEKWLDKLPQPIDWVHQLSSSRWAEAGRFFQGAQLPLKLSEIMKRLLKDM